MNIKFVCLAGLMLTLSSSTFALRCGSKIVDTGDTQDRVERICGAPSETSSRYVKRSINNIRNRELRQKLKRSSSASRYMKVEVRIDEWTYRLGPRRIDKCVIFESGRVIEVKDAD